MKILHFCRTAQSALLQDFSKFQTFDLKILHFCRTPQSALLQDLSKYQTFDIRWNLSRIDWFSNYNTKFEVSGLFSLSFDPFGRIWKFCISAEQLSQLFCKIYRNFKLLIFVKISLVLIDFRCKIVNLECLDHFL